MSHPPQSPPTMSIPPPIFFYEESQTDRLTRKSKESPFFPVAIGTFVLAGAYGAYMYKYRGTMRTSVYLMRLRVIAQGLAIGVLTVGLGYSMFNEHILKRKDEDE